MPIRTAVPIRVFDQESFHRVDHEVTGIAFKIHNEFGRYLDEKLYQGELTRRCRLAGLDVEPEMRMSASLGDFKKDYLADHLVNQGVIVETKAVATLAPAHRGQTLNYLFMCGLHHATLLNFRTDRVQREFVSTRITSATRYDYAVSATDWNPMSSRCHELHDLLLELLMEWGAFLDPLLYRDACTHFLGGEARVVQEISVECEGEFIGTQGMHMLTEDIAFSVTASSHRPDVVLDHQRRFLRHTPVHALQWINLNHHNIELRTIENHD